MSDVELGLLRARITKLEAKLSKTDHLIIKLREALRSERRRTLYFQRQLERTKEAWLSSALKSG